MKFVPRNQTLKTFELLLIFGSGIILNISGPTFVLPDANA
jgi:hypothetical protein